MRTFKEMYGADAPSALISNVIESIIEDVVECQFRTLDADYAIIDLNRIVGKVRQAKRVINRLFIWQWAST